LPRRYVLDPGRRARSGRALALALALALGCLLAAGCESVLGIQDVTGPDPAAGDPMPDGATPLPPGPAADEFAYRRQIVIDAGGQGMPAGYSLRFVHDVRARLQEGKVRVDGNDWRVFRQDGDQMVEVPRWMDDSEGPFGTNPQASTWFRVSEALAGNEQLTAYWVYYGHPDLDTPPPDELDDVFLFGDDFESDLSKWTANQRGEMVQVQSETIYAGGQSLRIEPGTAQVGGGIYRDIALPHETLMFSHYLRQAQTGASFGHLHTLDKSWAERDVDTWRPAQARAWGELGGGNALILFIEPGGTYTSWAFDYGLDIWRYIEVIYDPVANQLWPRVDGNAFAGPYSDFNHSGLPVANIAIEGQGEGGLFFMDNYIIRRYVDPEPVVNVGAEEAL
jgi:hypothetical protein